jgi:hypothetical protein
MKKKKILTPVIILSTTYIILFLLFLYRFYLRLLVSTNFHYMVHLIIALIICFDIYLVIIIAIRLKITYQLRPFVIIAFIGLSTLLFSRLNNRKNEIIYYYNKNKKNLTTIIQHDTILGSHSPKSYDTFFMTTYKDLNLRCYYKDKDITYLNLFGFISYGYGLAYTTKDFPKGPGSYRMCPIVDWYRIKDNWYYFSYLD